MKKSRLIKKALSIVPFLIAISFLITICVITNGGSPLDIKQNRIINVDGYVPPASDKNDIVIYQGEKYYGLLMELFYDELPIDFHPIGCFQGELTPDNKELTSTAVFHENETIYLFTERGKLNFVAKTKRKNVYIGIFGAQKYGEGYKNIDENHILVY